MNRAILMGRLTRDPEMRQTQSGIAVARFSIAINRRFNREETDFINCIAWRQTAEHICKYYQKGSMIAVVGSIRTRSWDGQDGKKQYATEVEVEETYFTGSRAEAGTSMGNNVPHPSNSQSSSQSNGNNNVEEFQDFDTFGFDAVDGSEDDLPF